MFLLVSNIISNNFTSGLGPRFYRSKTKNQKPTNFSSNGEKNDKEIVLVSYVDDLVILAEQTVGLQTLIDHTTAFLSKNGGAVND